MPLGSRHRIVVALAAAAALVALQAPPAAARGREIRVAIGGSSYDTSDVRADWQHGQRVRVTVERASEGFYLTLMTCDLANRSRAGSRVPVRRHSTGHFTLTLWSDNSAAAREVVREHCAALHLENRATFRTAKVRLVLTGG